MTEYSNIYRSEDGTEVEIKMKTGCKTANDMRKSLGFMAQCSHQFYLEAAEKFREETGGGPGTAFQGGNPEKFRR